MQECGLYTDPELYDSLFPNAGSGVIDDAVRRERILASEKFYLEEARRAGGQVLEMACGSGRLTIPIAQSGIDIVGADLSRSMLERARVKARQAGVTVRLVEADMRQFDLREKFAAILIPGNSLLHLETVDHWKRCLACVAKHLAPDGRLIFDISKWDIALLARPAGERFPALTSGNITIEESASYDAARQVREITWHFSTPEQRDYRVIAYRLRVVFPQELPLLLESAGFQLDARYGEFTREQFASSSPRQVCICSLTRP